MCARTTTGLTATALAATGFSILILRAVSSGVAGGCITPLTHLARYMDPGHQASDIWLDLDEDREELECGYLQAWKQTLNGKIFGVGVVMDQILVKKLLQSEI